ncbi:S8 family serine peptidase, partial [Streptococcus thermophilus]|nr:S8 family serine peptidase [Streptococcus thermophilus]
ANVQAVWSNYKYKGEGTVVSVIDTGIDPTHKDMRLSNDKDVKLTKSDVEKFTDTAKHGRYFNSKVPYGFNYADNNDTITDDTVDEQ